MTQNDGIKKEDRSATRHVCDFRKSEGLIDPTLSISKKTANGQTIHWLVREHSADHVKENSPTMWQRCWMITAISSLLSGIFAALLVHFLGRRKWRNHKNLSNGGTTAG